MKITLGKLSLAILAIAFTFDANAWAQAKRAASTAELGAYTGADREQRLLAGAKAEGKVVWYTSLAGTSYKELARAFEAKYPGVHIEPYRATSADLMTKIVAEAEAKRFVADSIETTLPVMRYMREGKMLAPYASSVLAKYPPAAVEKADRGLYYWGVDRETYMGVGYNTTAITGNMIPKSYGDLLKPELKGKIGFATSDTGARTIGAMLKFKGEEFVRKLKGQDVTLHAVSGRAMADMVISGEVGLSPTIFRDHALESKAKGAPIEWVPMEVVPTNAGCVALLAQAPHPNAAVLLADFLFTPGAQKILADLEYGSPFRPMNFKLWYPETGLSTAQYDKAVANWEKLLREIGRKPL
ncbi:MAG TPA: extracellular solute-binding protein [Candidatus Binatia bacterium]|jgi:iron(III) transport system substrate-binding protein